MYSGARTQPVGMSSVSGACSPRKCERVQQELAHVAPIQADNEPKDIDTPSSALYGMR